MEVKIKRLHKDAVIPKQATELAGGWDVVATEIIQEANDFVICKLGFSLQPPPNYKITLVPRSSLTKTKWILQNSPGLGDADFVGEYQYRLRALPCSLNEIVFSSSNSRDIDKTEGILTYPEFPFKPGDRIGQIYLEEVIPIEFIEVDELSNSNRLGGYGSTGNN